MTVWLLTDSRASHLRPVGVFKDYAGAVTSAGLLGTVLATNRTSSEPGHGQGVVTLQGPAGTPVFYALLLEWLVTGSDGTIAQVAVSITSPGRYSIWDTATLAQTNNIPADNAEARVVYAVQ